MINRTSQEQESLREPLLTKSKAGTEKTAIIEMLIQAESHQILEKQEQVGQSTVREPLITKPEAETKEKAAVIEMLIQAESPQTLEKQEQVGQSTVREPLIKKPEAKKKEKAAIIEMLIQAEPPQTLEGQEQVDQSHIRGPVITKPEAGTEKTSAVIEMLIQAGQPLQEQGQVGQSHREDVSSQPFDLILPEPIQDLALDYVDEDIGEVKSIYTSNHACTLFESGRRESSYDKLALIVLLKHVIRGEQTQAEVIIKTNDALLFATGTVRDLSGNTFVGFSPCRLACFGHDIEMLNMMMPYVKRVEGGSQKLAAIIREAKREADTHPLYDFEPLINAINSGDSDRIDGAYARFKQDFSPKIIKEEKSFNPKPLAQAYKVYAWGNNAGRWSPEQITRFWRECVGYLQSRLGEAPSYAQALCQQLVRVVDGYPLNRSLVLIDGTPFFSVDCQSPKRLGIDFAVASDYIKPRAGLILVDSIDKCIQTPGVYFMRLADIKIRRLDQLLRSLEPEKESENENRCCRMM